MEYQLYNDDCRNVIGGIDTDKQIIIVTDPPFNIGYHYNSYNDKIPDDEYCLLLKQVLTSNGGKFVIIHYPEAIYKLAVLLGQVPERVISWVYNSNSMAARQHRDIAFFGFEPDMSLVKQPYKNQNDKRIQQRILDGNFGASLYDWWYADQIKNISEEKTIHPCQMPQQVLDNIIGIIPDKENTVIVDPFMGSCTTGLACIKHNVDFIGIDMDKEYYELSKKRMDWFKESGQIQSFRYNQDEVKTKKIF